MARQSSEDTGGCGGSVVGAVLGLLLGSGLTAMIVGASLRSQGYGTNPAAGPDYGFAALGGAIGGGFFGLLLGAISGGILGKWIATKSAGGGTAGREGEAMGSSVCPQCSRMVSSVFCPFCQVSVTETGRQADSPPKPASSTGDGMGKK